MFKGIWYVCKQIYLKQLLVFENRVHLRHKIFLCAFACVLLDVCAVGRAYLHACVCVCVCMILNRRMHSPVKYTSR